MGLLQKALLLEKHFFAGFSFSALCKKHAVSTAAVFTRHENVFSVSACIGFDAESISKSVSTADFWTGLFQNKNYIDAELDALSPYFQLFSDTIKKSLSHIMCKKISNETFCMLILQNEEMTNVEINDFFSDVSKYETGDNCFENRKFDFSPALKSGSAALVLLDANSAIRTSLKNQGGNEKLSNALYTAIFSKLFDAFLKPNAIFPSCKNRANIILFSHENFDLLLLHSHLSSLCEPILANASSLISLKKIGSAKHADTIARFINA